MRAKPRSRERSAPQARWHSRFTPELEDSVTRASPISETHPVLRPLRLSIGYEQTKPTRETPMKRPPARSTLEPAIIAPNGCGVHRSHPPHLTLFLSGLLQLTLLSPLHGETIGWHPDLTLEPGCGLEYRQQYLLKPRVALLDPSAATNYSGTGSASYSASFSQHQLDLVSRFSLNLNVSAKYGVYSGKVGFSYVDDTAYTGNTLNFVFECNRDYGFTRFRPSALDSDFISEINRLRQTLRGQALQKAITERFGDYFISGYKSVGKVVVIYTFNFESQTTARSITASIAGKYKNGVTSVQFQSDVQSFFQQTDSSVSMSYRFFSSDPNRPLLFPTNQITSYGQFVTFSTVVGDYCNNMSPTGAARTEFIVEPMQNLPGYSALVEGAARPISSTDYAGFSTLTVR